jgi:hypothetical protein
VRYGSGNAQEPSEVAEDAEGDFCHPLYEVAGSSGRQWRGGGAHAGPADAAAAALALMGAQLRWAPSGASHL